MHESPSSAQLLKAVIAFLTDIAAPQLTGHAQFHARVSANALALVAREIAKKEAADTKAKELYAALLTNETKHIDLKSLEAALCEAIRRGDLNVETPNLLANLRQVAIAQLAIDQPTYSGLKQP